MEVVSDGIQVIQISCSKVAMRFLTFNHLFMMAVGMCLNHPLEKYKTYLGNEVLVWL